MKLKPVWLAIPVAVLVGVGLLLTVWPSSSAWPVQPLFHYLPAGLFALAAVLGAAFTQTRVAFVALCAAAVFTLLDHAYFGVGDPARGDATLLLASVILPILVAVFHRLSERGLFTPFGLTRFMTVLVLVAFLFLLPWIKGFQVSVTSSAPPSFRTAAGWWRIPGVGVLALVACLPFLVLRRKGESPRLGPFLAVTLIVFAFALNFQSGLWRENQRQTALLLFGALGATLLVATVLESVWRQMNIDELTELPGRRPFRHHLRCLGGDYTMAVVDIDHFKNINDTYGHAVGDQVLKFLATEFSRQATGRVYRYGGEEFAIIYESGAYDRVLDNLDDLREAVGRKTFYLRGSDRAEQKPRRRGASAGGPPRQITLNVSIGAAKAGANYATPQAVFEAADQALYRAKEQGRNRVCYVK